MKKIKKILSIILTAGVLATANALIFVNGQQQGPQNNNQPEAQQNQANTQQNQPEAQQNQTEAQQNQTEKEDHGLIISVKSKEGQPELTWAQNRFYSFLYKQQAIIALNKHNFHTKLNEKTQETQAQETQGQDQKNNNTEKIKTVPIGMVTFNTDDKEGFKEIGKIAVEAQDVTELQIRTMTQEKFEEFTKACMALITNPKEQEEFAKLTLADMLQCLPYCQGTILTPLDPEHPNYVKKDNNAPNTPNAAPNTPNANAAPNTVAAQ